MPGGRKVLARRPADDEVGGVGLNLLYGLIDLREVLLENGVVEVGLVDIDGGLPELEGRQDVNPGLLEAEGHPAATGEEVNRSYLALVLHALRSRP